MALTLIFQKLFYYSIYFVTTLVTLLPIVLKFTSRICINLVLSVLASCVVVISVTYVYGLVIADYLTLVTLISVFCYLTLPKESAIIDYYTNLVSALSNK